MIVSTISEKVDKSDVESISSETIKDESGLSLSRAYSITSEPPVSIPLHYIPRNELFLILFWNKWQAYKKQTASSVRIARLIAITVVAVALILGTAIVLAAYLQTRHTNNSAIHSAAPAAASSTETNVSPPFLNIPFFSISCYLLFVRTRAGWAMKKATVDFQCFSLFFFIILFFLAQFFFVPKLCFCAWSTSPHVSKSIQCQTPAKRKEVKRQQQQPKNKKKGTASITTEKPSACHANSIGAHFLCDLLFLSPKAGNRMWFVWNKARGKAERILHTFIGSLGKM